MTIFVRDKSFYKMLLVLAVPIILQNLVTFSVGFIDNLMVGALGETAISGVYLGNQVQMILQILMIGIAMALQVLSMQYWGKRDTDSIKHIVAIGFRMTIVVSGAFWLVSLLFPDRVLGLFTSNAAVMAEGRDFLQFLCWSFVFFGISQHLIATMRSVEQVKIGMYISVLALVLHFILNWLLIYGNLGLPALGVRGAGISILVSRFFEAGFAAVYVLFVDRRIKLRLHDLLIRDRDMFRDFFRYGSPIIAGQVVWAVNRFVNGAIIGRFDAGAIAAASITNMMQGIVFIFAMGVSAGVGIITGKTVGAGEYDKMKLYAKTIQVIFLGIGILSALLILVMMDPLLQMYNITADTKVFGRQFMSVLAVTVIGTCYQGTLLGGLVKSGGDTSFVFINDTIFVFLVVIPSSLLALLVFQAPPWVVFACLKSDEVLKCIVAVIKINRFNWMKNLTRVERREKVAISIES